MTPDKNIIENSLWYATTLQPLLFLIFESSFARTEVFNFMLSRALIWYNLEIIAGGITASGGAGGAGGAGGMDSYELCLSSFPSSIVFALISLFLLMLSVVLLIWWFCLTY